MSCRTQRECRKPPSGLKVQPLKCPRQTEPSLRRSHGRGGGGLSGMEAGRPAGLRPRLQGVVACQPHGMAAGHHRERRGAGLHHSAGLGGGPRPRAGQSPRAFSCLFARVPRLCRCLMNAACSMLGPPGTGCACHHAPHSPRVKNTHLGAKIIHLGAWWRVPSAPARLADFMYTPHLSSPLMPLRPRGSRCRSEHPYPLPTGQHLARPI